ncbi:hypothetical protein EDB83DRAFT_1952856 [Lactarius deliciosus]|nr:hypothetical protein EDB83DRAFT_1952856 [Lactarius deliciosus]
MKMTVELCSIVYRGVFFWIHLYPGWFTGVLSLVLSLQTWNLEAKPTLLHGAMKWLLRTRLRKCISVSILSTQYSVLSLSGVSAVSVLVSCLVYS